MLVDFSRPILGLDGTPLKQGEAADSPDMTLGDVAVSALLETLFVPGRREPENLPAEAKVRNAALALAIRGAGESVDVKIEDLSLLKERIGRAFTTMIVFRAFALLEDAG